MVTRTLALPHGTVDLPAFMPDATCGFVRGLTADGLKAKHGLCIGAASPLDVLP